MDVNLIDLIFDYNILIKYFKLKKKRDKKRENKITFEDLFPKTAMRDIQRFLIKICDNDKISSIQSTNHFCLVTYIFHVLI